MRTRSRRQSSPTRGDNTPETNGESGEVSIASEHTATSFGEKSSVSEESNTEVIRKAIESKTPAYVRIAGGKTINLGNFESLRIDVAVELPSEPNRESVIETYKEAADLVDNIMIEQLSKGGQS